MSYNPATDFLALLRFSSDVRSGRMPGLDWLVSALNRMGLFTLFVGQTAPTTNQAATVWIQPALPSWTAEGTVWLWNAALVTPAYEAASPALWVAFLAAINSGYSFQSVTGAAATIAPGTTLVAVQRAAPVTTTLTLPGLGAQWATGKPSLRIIDFSTAVANHTIALNLADGSTIMRQAAWSLLSTADSLAGINLYASPDLNSWVIA